MNCLIVGSGSVDSEQLRKISIEATLIIAADGGFDALQKEGIKPDIVLGDFDSLTGDIPKGAIVYQAEKDFSDMQAAIKVAVDRGSDQVFLLGATGTRADHFLTTLMMLFNYNQKIHLLDLHNDIFVKTESFSLKKTGLPFFSLIVLDEIELSICGAKYPLDNKKISFGTSITLSNEFLEEEVKVSFSKGRVIVVRSRDNKKTPWGFDY